MSRQLKGRIKSKDWGFVSDFELQVKPEKFTTECWLSKYTPKDRKDLAVHKKKVDQVASAIKDAMTTNRHKVIVLTGPCGTGKSATVHALASDLGYSIEEWINPIHEYEAGVHYETEISKFKSFLLSSSRYGSLFENQDLSRERQNNSSDRKIVLLEGIPTFATRNPAEFWDIIKSHSRSLVHPVVVILSNSSLGVRVPFGLINISFNPIANTFMTKALKTIAQKESVTLTLSDIVQQCEGDLRNAILTLQFQATAKGTASGPPRKQPSARSGKRKRVGSNEASNSKKDTHLFMLHAIGKLLYAKRKEDTPLDVNDVKLGRKDLEFVPEAVAEQCTLSGEFLNQFLHHNYLAFYNDIDRLQLPSDIFCDSDNLSNYWVDDTTNTQMWKYSVSLSTRAIAFSRDTSFMPGFTPICGPIQRETENTRLDRTMRCRDLFALDHMGANNSFLVDTVPYLKKLGYKPINGEQYSLLQSLSNYQVNRSGGKSIGNTDTMADIQESEIDYVSNKDDEYLALAKNLEEEIQDFSD